MQNTQASMIISVSQKASNNGVYFYNKLFENNGINTIYRSCPTNSIESFKCSMQFLNIDAASIAAPYKTTIIDQLDELTEIAQRTNSVNSVKKHNQKFIGHNTDALGLINIFHELSKSSQNIPKTFLIYGSGGVVPSIIYAINEVFHDKQIFLSGRNQINIENLSKRYNLCVLDSADEMDVDVWINATPASLSNPQEIYALCRKASSVFDLNPILSEYDFEILVKNRGQDFIRGFDFYLEQFMEQYMFYTGQEANKQYLENLVGIRIKEKNES